MPSRGDRDLHIGAHPGARVRADHAYARRPSGSRRRGLPLRSAKTRRSCHARRSPHSWRDFARRAMVGRIDRADVEREWSAQIDRALAVGATLTHLDSHQHLHQWPPLWPVVRRLARQAGVRAIRTTAAHEPSAVDALGRVTRSRARRAGLRTTDSFAGFRHSGELTEPTLVRLLDGATRDVSIELGCHPEARHDPDRSRWEQVSTGQRKPTRRATTGSDISSQSRATVSGCSRN